MPHISINQITRQQSKSPAVVSDVLNNNESKNLSVLLILTALVVGLLSSVSAYVALPMAGIEVFQNQLGLKKLLALALLPVLIAGYLLYWQKVQKSPIILSAFMAIFWMPVSFFNEQLLGIGINLHLRALLMVAIVLPALWVVLKHVVSLLKDIPYFKWMTLFMVVLSGYFVFNNASQIGEGFGVSNQSAASIGLIQFESYLYSFLAIGVTAIAFLKWKNINAEKAISTFDAFNKCYLIVSMVIAVVTIAGYPFGATSMILDGFRRAFGLFTHPNPYAHSMGVQVLYILGISLYYNLRNQHNRFDKMPMLFMWTALGLNSVAFLLALSKTAIAFVALSSIIFIALNASSKEFKKTFSKLCSLAVVLIPLSLMAYSLITGQSFTEVLQSRFEETTSMDWRSQVWEYILDNFSLEQMLLGNGFTASNMLIYQMTYHNVLNSKPLIMVHNGYLSLLYDLGVWGLSLFVAVLSCGISAVKKIKSSCPESKVLLSTACVTGVYFLCVSGFDEMTYMFNAPLLFWVFATACFSLALIHNQEFTLSTIEGKSND